MRGKEIKNENKIKKKKLTKINFNFMYYDF